ncbi:hypothetical protein V8F20_004058 [Naviculisporaceae sp. PSN 640]
MASKKRVVDESAVPVASSSSNRRGLAATKPMPNLRLAVLTADVLIDGREAAVAAITKLIEATNNQVGHSIFAAPLEHSPQFLAELGHDETVSDNSETKAPSGHPLVPVPTRERILAALGNGPRYIHDVLRHLGLDPTRANSGYMPPRDFVPTSAGTQSNLNMDLGVVKVHNDLKAYPMVQQYLDLVSQEKFHLYRGVKAFLARCKAHKIEVLALTDHQTTLSQIIREERVPEDHIAIIMSHLSASLTYTHDFYKVFDSEIVSRFGLNPLPRYIPLTHATKRGAIVAEGTGDNQPGNERQSDENTTKDNEGDTTGPVIVRDTDSPDETNTDTRQETGPIKVDDTPELPMITVTPADGASVTSSTDQDNVNATKSKGKRPDLEPLKIINPAPSTSQDAQPRTPIQEDPHTPNQPTGSFYSDTLETPATPTVRQMRRRAESPTTPTPPQGSRAHPRQPAPTPSRAQRVSNTPGPSTSTSTSTFEVEMPGSFFRNALGVPRAAPSATTRIGTKRPRPVETSVQVNQRMPTPGPIQMGPAPPRKDIIFASSTPQYLMITARAIGAKKVWIKNHLPNLPTRPRDQLPPHQEGFCVELNNITELSTYLFGDEEDDLGLDFMDLDVLDDDAGILQFSARGDNVAGASASAAVAGPASLVSAGPGVDKGKGKAISIDDDSDDDVQILG